MRLNANNGTWKIDEGKGISKWLYVGINPDLTDIVNKSEFGTAILTTEMKYEQMGVGPSFPNLPDLAEIS